MGSAARFLAQFFPIFLLGAIFGKLMDDSRSVSAVADFMTKSLGERRVILAVVLAGAFVTYGGVSLFVAFFVLVPMAEALFRAAAIPRRLMPAAIVLGTSTFTMSALPGTPSIQNAIPMPFFGTTPFAAPGLGIIAAAIMLGFGLWWLRRAEASARRAGEGYGAEATVVADGAADDELVRERATTAREFDPAEMHHGDRSVSVPPALFAALPLVVVVAVNLLMSLIVLPRLDFSYLPKNAGAQLRFLVWLVYGPWWSRSPPRSQPSFFATAGASLRCDKAWMRAPMPRFCRLSVSRASSGLAPLSLRCLLLQSYAIGCWE